MNDFKQLVHERKVTARSAKNHVNARRGRCRLPHDNITRKEWEKLNGEITTVNTKAPMKWEEFKSLPKGLQEIYYNTVAKEYGVGTLHMSRMMGTTKQNLVSYIRNHGIKAEPCESRGRLPQDKLTRWEEFVGVDGVEIKESVDKEKLIWSYSITVCPKKWEDVFDLIKTMPLPECTLVTVTVQ